MPEPTHILIDRYGDPQAIPAAQVPDALASGFVPASEQQAKDYALQQEYGGVGSAAAAFGEHAASALTLGASDWAERLLGVSPEGMAAREKAHPVASALGTAAGVIAPLVASGGTSAAAQGARLTAPALLSRAGAAATKAIGKGVVGAAAGSAIEGAAYGLGQVVHEAALGNPELTAENALWTVAASGGIGGALGAAGGVMGGLMKRFAPGDYSARVRSMLEAAEGHANLNATAAMPGEVKKVLQNKGASIGVEARDLGILRNPVTDSADTILERSQAVVRKAGDDMGALLKAADESGAAPRLGIDQVLSEAEPKILSALRKQAATVDVADAMERQFANFRTAYAGREMGLADLHALRMDLDDIAFKFGKTLDPFQRDVGQPLMRLRGHLTDLIEQGLKAGGQDLKAWEAANRAVEVGKTMERLANSGVERSAANNAMHLTGMMGSAAGLVAGGAPGAIALGLGSELVRRRGASAVGWAARALRGVAGDAEALAGKTAEAIAAERKAGADTLATQAAENAPERVAALAHLERNNAKVSSRLDSGLARIIRGTAEAEGAEAAQKASPRQLFSERTEEVQRLANPEILHSSLSGLTDDLADHAPQTAQAMQIAAARMATFLASKVPQQPQRGPLAPPWTPMMGEVARFSRYYDAALGGMPRMLARAAAGTMTPEDIETAQALWPAQLAHVRQVALEHLAEHKGAAIPSSGRRALSAILGMTMDSSDTGLTIAGNQAIYAPKPQPLPPMPRRAVKFTTSERHLTPQQASAARR